MPLKVIGTQYQRSPIGFLAKESSGITKVTDIADKRIGVVQTSVSVLQAVLKLNDLPDRNVMILSAGNYLQPLLEDLVDVLVAFDTNQGASLDLMGIPWVFFRFDDLGYRQESYPFFVSEATLAGERSLLADFMTATKQGWKYALAHPEEMAELTVRKHATAGNQAQEAGLARRQALVMESELTRRRGLFYMNRETWQATNSLLAETGLLQAPIDLDDLLTWELLEGDD